MFDITLPGSWCCDPNATGVSMRPLLLRRSKEKGQPSGLIAFERHIPRTDGDVKPLEAHHSTIMGAQYHRRAAPSQPTLPSPICHLTQHRSTHHMSFPALFPSRARGFNSSHRSKTAWSLPSFLVSFQSFREERCRPCEPIGNENDHPFIHIVQWLLLPIVPFTEVGEPLFYGLFARKQSFPSANGYIGREILGLSRNGTVYWSPCFWPAVPLLDSRSPVPGPRIQLHR